MGNTQNTSACSPLASKWSWTLLITLAFMALAAACHRETRDEALLREAKTFTQNECPKEVEPFVTMDSMTYNPAESTMTYSYTVGGELDQDELYDDALQETFYENILRKVKNSIDMRRMKDERLTFVYRYMSRKSGREYFNVCITPEDYGK